MKFFPKREATYDSGYTPKTIRIGNKKSELSQRDQQMKAMNKIYSGGKNSGKNFGKGVGP